MLNSAYHRTANGYRVPPRFSVGEILAMLTVFGLLFGGLRCYGAPSVLYMFLGIQTVAVCLVQMKFGRVARGASMIVGGVFVPICVWGLFAAGSPHLSAQFKGTWLDVLATVLFGGLLGYCTGTLVAGVFLVMDLAAGFAQRAAHRRARQP